jgi:hypothetical protein
VRRDEQVRQDADGWTHSYRVGESETVRWFPKARTPCDFDCHAFCTVPCDCECHPEAG